MNRYLEAPEWRDLHRAENAYIEARMKFFKLPLARRLEILGQALSIANHRGTALEILKMMDEVDIRPLLPALVTLASSTVSHIALVRSIIAKFDKDWLHTELPAVIEPLLDHGGEWEYRRLAELLEVVDQRLLSELVIRAAANLDPDVREVAADFSVRLGRL